MEKKYFAAGILILAVLAAAIYKGDPEKLQSAIRSAIEKGPSAGQKDAAGKADPDLDRIVSDLKKAGVDKNRTIVTSSGGSGGSAGSGSCLAGQAAGGGSGGINADYFVKAVITDVENNIDAESGRTVTYVYADVEEYDKVTGTVTTIDNESGRLLIENNATEAEYLSARSSIPDLSPEQLLIVSVSDSGGSEGQEYQNQDFSNIYLKYENSGLSLVC